jgi:hypothetical protein
LAQYLSKATEHYVTCLDAIGEDAVDGVRATARFHCLKIDPVTGHPKFNDLAALLAAQLTEYCFSTQRRLQVHEAHAHQLLHQEARAFLRQNAKSGEPGELLVYFLIEAILNAPQLIAKLQLKTNTNLESFGADGVHLRWHDADQILEIICAESKLEDTPSDAIANCAKSITKFHANEQHRHELRLATNHFKHVDPAFQAVVSDILEGRHPSVKWRLRHACLAGYDWKGYAGLPGNDIRALEAEFQRRYAEDKTRLLDLVKNHFGASQQPLIVFDVFLLPFRTVQEFREAFLAAV